MLRGGQDNGLRLLLGDRTVDMPAWLRPAMEQILAWQQFRPADLAETLDPQSRIVLCRRLIREGLLTPVR